MKEKYIVEAIITIPCRVVVVGEHIGDALNRFQEGAWHGVTPNFDHAGERKAVSIHLKRGE